MKRLQHIEKLTWGQFIALPRESGLTPEKFGSEGFWIVDAQNSSERKLVERYYFHFRIEQKGLSRVFVYQCDQFFCITHIDYQGKIYH